MYRQYGLQDTLTFGTHVRNLTVWVHSENFSVLFIWQLVDEAVVLLPGCNIWHIITAASAKLILVLTNYT